MSNCVDCGVIIRPKLLRCGPCQSVIDGDETPRLDSPRSVSGYMETDPNKCKCGEYKNMLDDVVNELDLSGGAVEQYGQLGTPPAELVRLVLKEKDKKIAMLKQGIKEVAL